jgi:putative RNA 2'-phosphotransferase
MNEKQTRAISKFLSLVLRHKPEEIGISLDEAGWVEVEVLLAAMGRHGMVVSRAELDEVVATNDKKRFAFSEDGVRIRASQGHSVSVELGLQPVEPPEVLLHGTATRFLEAIRREGLRAMSRQHVHLHDDRATAEQVGSRHGKLVVLEVRAGEMHRAGKVFYRSANGVWLTEAVPVEFIVSPDVREG